MPALTYTAAKARIRRRAFALIVVVVAVVFALDYQFDWIDAASINQRIGRAASLAIFAGWLVGVMIRPSPTLRCLFCRTRWPRGIKPDHRVTCATCARRARPYLLQSLMGGDLFSPRPTRRRRWPDTSDQVTPQTITQRAVEWIDTPMRVFLGALGVAALSIWIATAFFPTSVIAWILPALALTLVALLIWAIVASVLRTRALATARLHTCYRCGYDLRAAPATSPGLVRCPECGTDHAPDHYAKTFGHDDRSARRKA